MNNEDKTNEKVSEKELEQSMWAVGTAQAVIATDLTYDEAIKIVNENLAKPGLCIITAEAAKRQVELSEARGKKSNGTNPIDD